MKKLSVILLGLTIILLISGCGGTAMDTTPVGTSPSGSRKIQVIVFVEGSVVGWNVVAFVQKVLKENGAATQDYDLRTVDISTDKNTAKAYQIKSAPSVVFVDKDGKVVATFKGMPAEVGIVNAYLRAMGE